MKEIFVYLHNLLNDGRGCIDKVGTSRMYNLETGEEFDPCLVFKGRCPGKGLTFKVSIGTDVKLVRVEVVAGHSGFNFLQKVSQAWQTFSEKEMHIDCCEEIFAGKPNLSHPELMRRFDDAVIPIETRTALIRIIDFWDNVSNVG